MNEFIVRTSDVSELEKFATINITHKFKFLNLVAIDTTLSKKRVRKIKGVYSVEDNDVYGTFCG
jgi:hypothetical protein